MVIRNLRSGRRLAVLALFAILAMSAFGFAAQNNVANSNAGAGAGDVNAFNITNISYELSATNYGVITSVTFDISPAASDVHVAFDTPSDVFCCTDNGGGTNWTCDTTSTTVNAEDVLELNIASVS
jgi:hypothetical protein